MILSIGCEECFVEFDVDCQVDYTYSDMLNSLREEPSYRDDSNNCNCHTSTLLIHYSVGEHSYQIDPVDTTLINNIMRCLSHNNSQWVDDLYEKLEDEWESIFEILESASCLPSVEEFAKTKLSDLGVDNSIMEYVDLKSYGEDLLSGSTDHYMKLEDGSVLCGTLY